MHKCLTTDYFPYLYSSFYVFEADRQTQQYKFASFANLTSSASALYSGFMYEAILRTATDDPDFKFAVRSSPLPPRSFQL